MKLLRGLLLLFALMAAMVSVSRAATATVASVTVPDCQWCATQTSAMLRIYASESFFDAAGVPHVGGAIGTTNYFKAITLILHPSSYEIPQFTIPTTTDSPDKPNVKYAAVIYDGHNIQRGVFLDSFRIAASLASTTATWVQIRSANPGSAINPPSNLYYTINQADAIFATKNGSFVPATRAFNTQSPLQGGGDFSTDRTLTCPTCAVTSDARFPTANEKAAMAGTSGSPSNTNRYVTASDPSFAPPVVVFDANAAPYLAVPEDITILNNGARITQCIQAAVDYSLAHGKVAVSVQLTSGLYYINDLPSTANLARAQITFPLTTYLQSLSLTIEPKGRYSGGPSLGPGWLTSSQSGNSVVFSSPLTGLAQTAAGTPFVMGGPDDVNQGSYPTGKSWLFVTLRDVGFVVPANPTLGCFNGKNVGQVYLKNVSCHAQAPNPTAFPSDYTQPTHPTGLSFLVPSTLGDGAIYEGKIDVNGMYAGPGIGEHTVSNANIFVYKCNVGLNYEGSTALPVAYGPVIQHFEDVQNRYGIATVDPSSGIVPISVGPSLDNVQPILINNWIIEEASSGWNARVAGIYDPASRLAGIVNFRTDRLGTGTNRGFTEPQHYLRNVKAVSLAEPFWERDFLVDPLYGNGNGASLTGRWPQRNQGDNWHTIPSSGAETITSFTYSGTVSPNSAESGNYIDESISDTVSSAQVMFNSLGSNWLGLGVRYQDENHYWIVRWDANGTISLKKKTAADTYSTVATGTLVPVASTWYTMVVATNGNSIEVFVDGTAIMAVNDASYATQTKVLIMGGSSGAITIKTLRVTPLFL